MLYLCIGFKIEHHGPGRFPVKKQTMNKTLSNSEFAQMIAARFPAFDRFDRDIMVFDETGNCAIYAKDPKRVILPFVFPRSISPIPR